MLNYKTFCYLQNQKTASTFVEELLLQFAIEEPVEYVKHHAPTARVLGKFYFLNVRDPLDLYLSLFNYGLDQKGRIYKVLTRHRKDRLYERGIDGFDEWLSFVLDPQNARLISLDFVSHAEQGMGLASWRYLRLATFDFTFDHPAVNYVIRFENLVADLTHVVTNCIPWAFRDVDAVVNWIAQSQPVNVSNRRDKTLDIQLSESTRNQLLDRDSHLYSRFYRTRRDELLAR